MLIRHCYLILSFLFKFWLDLKVRFVAPRALSNFIWVFGVAEFTLPRFKRVRGCIFYFDLATPLAFVVQGVTILELAELTDPFLPSGHTGHWEFLFMERGFLSHLRGLKLLWFWFIIGGSFASGTSLVEADVMLLIDFVLPLAEIALPRVTDVIRKVRQ